MNRQAKRIWHSEAGGSLMTGLLRGSLSPEHKATIEALKRADPPAPPSPPRTDSELQ